MEVNAIIAEYNPFHKGHAYQIKSCKNKNSRAFVIALMSTYFCQRGEPACLSPRARTAMALSAGADLVLALPCYASLASAELFADTGVTLLNQTGLVSQLVFGSETDDLRGLKTVADLLVEEANDLWTFIDKKLKEGHAYARARELYVAQRLGASYATLLRQPNQILAIEYLKAIKKRSSTIKPILIKRLGEDFLSEKLAPDQAKQASALAIRSNLAKLLETPQNQLDLDIIKTLTYHIPHQSLAILLKEISNHAFMVQEELAPLYYSILENTQTAKTRYLDQDLFNRLKSNLTMNRPNYPSIEELTKAAMTRQYPLTRVKRALTNLLLNIETVEDFKPAYIHVLGFSRNGRYLLKKMREKAKLPIITNFSQLKKQISKADLWQEKLEIRAARTWLNTAKLPLNQLFDSPIIMR